MTVATPDLALCPHEWKQATNGRVCQCDKCGEHATFWVPGRSGKPDVLYHAQPHQLPYHESEVPNLIMVGPRGTGKSITERMDVHMRAMLPGPPLTYLVMRRKMTDLKKSHLIFLNNEMSRLGGSFHNTDYQAKYPNGSLGFYGHCDTPADMMNYLSAQYDVVVVDEITTFTQEIIVKMASCVRVVKDSGRIGLLRGGTNKLGPGAEFVRRYFFDKDVDPADDEEYNPDEWQALVHKWGDNKFIDLDQYKKRMSSLPEHIRKAWLHNEWVIEGAYFTDFRPNKDGEPWHVITELPKFQGHALIGQNFINVYRAIDWGYQDDPAVCLWIAVLPNGRAIVFKERTWHQTLAADVAKQIKVESAGMRILDTFCDPTMKIDDGRGAFTIGEIFERNGVPVTPSVNKRDEAGYAIHNYLNTVVGDVPKLQILAENGSLGCPRLIKTLPVLQMDDVHPERIAKGPDHWAIALAYFCMGQALPAKDPKKPTVPRWMQPKRQMYAGFMR